jgi:hypothetical protein
LVGTTAVFARFRRHRSSDINRLRSSQNAKIAKSRGESAKFG